MTRVVTGVKFVPDERAIGGRDPLRVFLRPHVVLEIPRGALLRTVAAAIGRRLKLNARRAARLAAFYFALGERRPGAPWTAAERSTAPGRRYRPRRR